MTALVLAVGAPGAGKSSLLGRLFPDADAAGQIVSLDDYRWMLTANQNDQSANPAAVQIMNIVLAERTSRRLFTVVDATNSTVPAVRNVVNHARTWGIPTVAVVAHTPHAVCLHRQADRTEPTPRAPDGRVVPGDQVTRIHNEVQQLLPVLPDLVDVVAHYPDQGHAWRQGSVQAGLAADLPWLAQLPPPTPVPDRTNDKEVGRDADTAA